MSCLVKLFEPDSASPPVHTALAAASIELLAVDQTTRINCTAVQSNNLLTSGRGYGADLQFSLANIIYQVAISDRHQVYGGTTIMSLSGTTHGNLDVVLNKMPRTPIVEGSGTGRNAAQVCQAVLHEPKWNPSEKLAVQGTIDALSSLRGVNAPVVLGFVVNYEGMLRDHGIDPDLF